MIHPPGNDSITDVPGVKVGHASDRDHGTGVTVLLFESGAAGGVEVRGMATGGREFGALDPLHVTPACHALCLSGGSAFGLAAADGVMSWLHRKGIGYFARVTVVPIVPAAIIFDLSFISHEVRPGPAMGEAACEAAHAGPVEQGSVGAGTGATVGKVLGMDHAMKSGVGSASLRTGDGVTVGALAVVNNLGDVIESGTGRILAGARRPDAGDFVDSAQVIRDAALAPPSPLGENTNLVAVATDAKLDKVEAAKVARMASAGMARTLSPAHSTFDGDVVFAFSVGGRPSDVNRLGTLAADLVAASIERAVTNAEGLGGLPAYRDLGRSRD